MNAQLCAPASYAQEGIWFETLRGDAAGAYHEPLLLRFAARPDVSRLRAALDAVILRHAALRTVFYADVGGLQQRVLAAAPLAPAQLVPQLVSESRLAAHLAALRAAPFDLERGPLFRVHLVALEQGAHLLLLVAHHCIVDGWSLGVFCRDFSAFYNAWPQQPALPVLSRQSLDHGRRQRTSMAGPEAAKTLSYWKDSLAGVPAAPLFAPLTALPETAAAGAGQLACDMPAAQQQAVLALARRLHTTPFCLLLGVFASVLTQLTGRSDLTIATDVAERGMRGDEDLIGMFVNQLPLRLRVGQARSGRDFVVLARDACLGAILHKDAPYALIRRQAVRDGGASGADFQVKFVLHNAPHQQLDLPQLDAHLVDSPQQSAKFPLLLEFWQHGEQMRGTLVYHRGYIAPALAAELCAQMLARLDQVLADPDAPLAVAAVPAAPARPPFMPQRRAAGAAVVRVEPGAQLSGYPAVVNNLTPGLDPAEWMRNNQPLIDEHLLAAGGVLLRGFSVGTAQRFAALVEQISGPCLDYTERSTPRTRVANGIYTSTEYPADQEIFFHNENAYAHTWPQRIHFWCQQAPAGGGATPLADCRQVYAALPDQVRQAFERHGVLYRRHFQPGLGVGWQQAFGVDHPDALQQRFGPAGYRFEWHDGGLVASLRLPAVLRHPLSGARSWFNHAALFHAAALPPELRRQLAAIEGAVPQIDTRLGNDEPIPDPWIALIRDTYRRCASQFAWRADDLLILDNRTIAHGRMPYTPPRRIIAAMTGPSHHEHAIQQ